MKKRFTYIFILLLTLHGVMRLNAQVCSCWQTRDTSFHVVPFQGSSPPFYRNDDGSSAAISLPFQFCFWGTNESSVFINTNGNVTFGAGYSPFSSVAFPTNGVQMIAPFWADVDIQDNAQYHYLGSDAVFYKITPTHIIIQWDTVGYVGPGWCVHNGNYGDDSLHNTFQLILSNGNDPIIPNGNNVEFCYKTMHWTTGADSPGPCADNGDGFGGIPSTVGANQGDGIRYVQIGRFASPNANYAGQYPPGPNFDGVYWLDNRSFQFNLCSGQIAPLTSGVTPCDTFKVCQGDSITVPMYFFTPIQGDWVWAKLAPPIPPGFSIASNYPGNTDSLTIKIVGSPANYGFHTVNLYGYDNQVPSDTSFTSFVIEVDSAPKIVLKAVRDTICVGDTSVLTASGAKNYHWSTGSTTSSIKVSPASTTTYTLGVWDGGCVKDTGIKVTVLPKPAPTILAKPDSVCPADSVLLIAGGGGKYKWNTGQTKDSIWVKPDSTMKYTLTSSNGFCNDSTRISVYVWKKGSTTLTLSKDSLCPYDSATLTAIGGQKYVWKNNGSTANSIQIKPGITTTYTLISTMPCVIDTLIKTIHVVGLPQPVLSGRFQVCAGQGDTITVSGGLSYVWSNGSTNTNYIFNAINADSTLSVQVFNGKCYLDTVIKVTTKALPSVNIIGGDVCPGQCILLTANAVGNGNTFSWSNGATTDTTTVCPSSATTYNVNVSNGCIIKKSTSVNIFSPTLYACCTQTINLGETAKLTLDSAISCKWFPSTGLNCDTCKNVLASPTETTTYTVTGMDKNGCEDQTLVTVFVDNNCLDFTVPNIFTPNNDGINDDFVVNAQNLPTYSISIFDRWGKQVYISNNPKVYWNGTDAAGVNVSDGTYFYIIKAACLSGKTFDKKGFVQLVR